MGQGCIYTSYSIAQHVIKHMIECKNLHQLKVVSKNFTVERHAILIAQIS